MGYDRPAMFVFRVTQTDSNNSLVSIDTVGLFCSDIAFNANAGQKLCQWQFLTTDSIHKYSVVENSDHNVFEGIESCDSELFMHPARSCYQLLQFCPYPYFKETEKIGSKWDWSFDIGAIWAIGSIYPIKGVEHFKTSYLVKDTVTLKTKFGRLFCFDVEATSVSRFGTSSASYFLNNEYGLVCFTVKAINNVSFEFELVSKTTGIDALKSSKYFLWQYNYSKNRQNSSFLKLP